MTNFASATACIDGEYRYTLTRVWDEALPTMTFVLLNPSTADAKRLDPTLRRCVNFARREGFGGMLIVNLYAYRTKSPKVLKDAGYPVGPANDRTLAAVTGTVVAGWGAGAQPARVTRALELLPRLHVLDITKNGHPRHPLYIPGAAPLVEWAPRSTG